MSSHRRIVCDDARRARTLAAPADIALQYHPRIMRYGKLERGPLHMTLYTLNASLTDMRPWVALGRGHPPRSRNLFTAGFAGKCIAIATRRYRVFPIPGSSNRT